jgi:hypothetical protein
MPARGDGKNQNGQNKQGCQSNVKTKSEQSSKNNLAGRKRLGLMIEEQIKCRSEESEKHHREEPNLKGGSQPGANF